MFRKLIKIGLFIFPLFLLSAVEAFPETIEIDGNFKHSLIGTRIEYIEDRTSSLQFSDITSSAKCAKRWKKSDQSVPGFGFTRSVYWIRFTVKNSGEKIADIYVHQKYPLIDYCSFFVPGEISYDEIKTGDMLSFSTRPIPYRNFVFPLSLPAGSETTCYMRYETTSSMTISLELLSQDYFEYYKERESVLLWIFYGFLILMFIYNLFILFSSRDIAHLYYILFILSFLVFIMGQNGTAVEYLWPDSPWWANFSIPFTLGMLVFWVALFFRRFIMISKQSVFIDRITIAIAIVNLTAGISSLLFNNYRISMQVTAILTFISIVICITVIGYMTLVKKSRQSMFSLSAFAFLLVGAVLYILRAFSIVHDNLLTSYSLQVGSAVQIVLLSLGMQDKVNIMRINLMKAEKKYRSLVDGSSDIIFSLDENLNFLAVNRSIQTHLGFKEEDITGRNLADIIYRDSNDTLTMERNILKEHIAELKKNKTVVSFRTSLIASSTQEPREYTLKLEYTEIGGKVEIFGKAIGALDDSLLRFMEVEKHRYRINNFISNADVLSYRLTRNLESRAEQAEITTTRICLREIIINAIEHGSLGISFEEKSKALEKGNYIDFLNERLRDSKCAEHEVLVEYALDDRCVAYRITDEGGGFDYKVIMDRVNNVNKEMLPHGRGLQMAMQEFDIVEFNEKGNQILLVKYFGKGERRRPQFIEMG